MRMLSSPDGSLWLGSSGGSVNLYAMNEGVGAGALAKLDFSELAKWRRQPDEEAVSIRRMEIGPVKSATQDRLAEVLSEAGFEGPFHSSPVKPPPRKLPPMREAMKAVRLRGSMANLGRSATSLVPEGAASPAVLMERDPVADSIAASKFGQHIRDDSGQTSISAYVFPNAELRNEFSQALAAVDAGVPPPIRLSRFPGLYGVDPDVPGACVRRRGRRGRGGCRSGLRFGSARHACREAGHRRCGADAFRNGRRRGASHQGCQQGSGPFGGRSGRLGREGDRSDRRVRPHPQGAHRSSCS